MRGHLPPRPAPPRRRFSSAMVRRRRTALAVTLAVLAGALAAPAVGDVLPDLGPAQEVRGVDVSELRVRYQGAEITWSELHALQLAGRAGVTVVDRASARDTGLAHAFDTQGEAEIWTCVTSGVDCADDA